MPRVTSDRDELIRVAPAVYNARMTSRPQFSLRMLMFVMAMACLAAATMAPLRPTGRPTSVNGTTVYQYEWENLGLAIHTQSWLRLAACVVFPSVLSAAATTRSGYSRSFCLAALLPAVVPAVLLALYTVEEGTVVFENGRLNEEIEFLGMASYGLSERISSLWLGAFCVGAICTFSHWFLGQPGRSGAVATRTFAIRLTCAALLMAIAPACMILLPPSGNWLDSHPPTIWQSPIRFTLGLLVPAMLCVGAVQGSPMFRVFCRGGLVPAVAPAVLVCGIKVLGDFPFLWQRDWLFQWRWFILRMWALIPVFGLTAVLFCWLFQRGEAEAKRE